MGRVSWIAQVHSKCDHKYSYKRKVERDLTTEVDATTEQKSGVTQERMSQGMQSASRS